MFTSRTTYLIRPSINFDIVFVQYINVPMRRQRKENSRFKERKIDYLPW